MATIDLTERYDRERYLAGGRRAWTLDRSAKPVRAIVVHHSAGFYGPRLGLAATGDEELVQLDALAADHHARFGVGPGYHYVAFPSGRLYAVGKAGTHRAHTKGRNPASGERWNVEAIGVCAMGDYEAGEPSAPLLAALTEAVGEIRGYGFAESALIPGPCARSRADRRRLGAAVLAGDGVPGTPPRSARELAQRRHARVAGPRRGARGAGRHPSRGRRDRGVARRGVGAPPDGGRDPRRAASARPRRASAAGSCRRRLREVRARGARRRAGRRCGRGGCAVGSRSSAGTARRRP